MKQKILLSFLIVVGFCALVNAQKKPYNNLIITEIRMDTPEQSYIELTNKGNETIDLSEFELCVSRAWTSAFYYEDRQYFLMLPKKMLAPEKSFVIASASDFEVENWIKDPEHNREKVTKPEMYKLADLILHRQELHSNANDSITPGNRVLELEDGMYCSYLRHIYTIGDIKDSMIIDQVGGVFDELGGSNYEIAYDVAGYKDATKTSNLIRRASVTTGISEFTNHEANYNAARMQFAKVRGLDLADSEWIPVPHLSASSYYEGWRSAFWTVGNQGDFKLDENTLVPKAGSKVNIDMAKATITVPWGIRNDDSIMYQFERRPGLAWHYDYAPTTEDSAYISVRTGDKLTFYVCGNQATIKTFSIIVTDPTPSANIVIPKNDYDYERMRYFEILLPYSGYHVTDGLKGMDTISYIDYATRVDTLLKYLEKAPKASWKVVFKDGIEKPDLNYGNILRVTSENGNVKEYFLKLEKFVPSNIASLSSITWPDMPSNFKGVIADYYGWKGDTIPGFVASKSNYIVKIPLEYSGIPALIFNKGQINSKVIVNRAVSLEGTPADATVTFTVTAENDATINVYTVRFEKEKEKVNIQPFKGEPFISQVVIRDQYTQTWCEIVNPGTEPLDLSHYMIISGASGTMSTLFRMGNSKNAWSQAYLKYVPGKKWQDEANWKVQPRILEPDLATNSIVYPGDVFVMAGVDDSTHVYLKEADFNFRKTPWGADYGMFNIAIPAWNEACCYLFKILNDSVINGLKPAIDINDFELIDSFGMWSTTTWIIGGIRITGLSGYTRKPSIYEGNPNIRGSFGTNLDDSEWIYVTMGILQNLHPEWPYNETLIRVADGIGSHELDVVSKYKSTISSLVYKVSPGYSNHETIEGLISGITVNGFYNNIMKANALQTLKVKSSMNGNELNENATITKGDTLIVLSADSVNTSKYILDITFNGLSSNALLVSTKYAIDVIGTTGTVGGFNQGTLLKDVFNGVIVPAGAILTVTDANDAYMSFTKLNYDSAYVNVIATDKINFEVKAENGITKILYQLKPTASQSDAYITSDVYSVDQFASLIQFIPVGTTVSSLINNVYPATGAKIEILDKAGFNRETGVVYRDDKLLVTSADGNSSKAYYFSMLNFNVNTYLAYVISDDYQINQVSFKINGPSFETTLVEFKSKLIPSFGATLMVLDNKGGESTLSNLSLGDKLKVTAADGKTIAIYEIDFNTKAVDPLVRSIKIYPNPTTDRVIINGLEKGNRVQVFNTSGVTLRDVIVGNSTDYVSLAAQPSGIYIFVISCGNQHINIQKIIKR